MIFDVKYTMSWSFDSRVKELRILALFVLLLPLILTILEAEVNTTYVVPWNFSYLLRILNGM